MPTHSYFVVDRARALRAGSTLRLDRRIPAPVRQWFPQGLSNHGRDFALGKDADAEGVRIELLLELVRRHRFPRKPSRMQAFFAFGSVEEALRFRRQKQHEDKPIFELRGTSRHRGDMRHLRWRDDFFQDLSWAVAYWRGEATRRPQWEHLLRPDVDVVRMVRAGSGED